MIISIFLGMCIVWWFMYIAKGEATLMLKTAMLGSIVLIVAILALQFWENRKKKNDREKIVGEHENTDKNKV
jgi:high-affinity Fe2+/Pb2+ permease